MTTTSMTSMTAEERTERARNAANTRWADAYDWQSAPLDAAIAQLSDLRAELARAQEIVNKRVTLASMQQPVFCYNPACNLPIDLATGKWAGRRDRNNPETGEVESAYACSTRCWLYLTANFTNNPQATGNRFAPHIERPERPADSIGAGESAALVSEQPAPTNVPTSDPQPVAPVTPAEPVAHKPATVSMVSAIAVPRQGARR